MKARDYADVFREDLKEFREKTRQFYQGELSVADYKGFSGGFGSYAQRGAELGMFRFRLRGGRITKEEFAFLRNSVNTYNINHIHITTCQAIQLHNLTNETICSIIEEAWDHGIISRGGGGDYPRNVMMSPLSGVDPNEAFDLTGYVEEVSDYSLSFIKEVKLPRKLKICFSSTKENYPHATYRDLGFVANANHTFDVFSAGGLGRSPMLGVCVGKNIPPSEVLYYVRAMVDTFVAHGNYQIRGKARTRFMQESLGQEGYFAAFEEKLVAAKENFDLTLPEIKPRIIKKTANASSFIHPRVLPQKQEGLFSLYYHPQGGNLTPKTINALYDAFLTIEDVEVRLTPDQGCYFINLTKEEALALIELTNDSATTEFETSVACVGNKICQVGISDSPTLLSSIFEVLKPMNFKDKVLPQIHISGCPSSCGTHQSAAIGFRGGMKQTKEGPVPAFAIFLGGCSLYGKEHLGEEQGLIETTKIPEFLVELGTTISNASTTFEEFVITRNEEFLLLVNKYV